MNKIKLLMLLILAATGMTVSAADAGFKFVESDDHKTLTIKGYGDLTTCSQTSTKKVFAAAANGNIYTNNSGASVNAQDDYKPLLQRTIMQRVAIHRCLTVVHLPMDNLRMMLLRPQRGTRHPSVPMIHTST